MAISLATPLSPLPILSPTTPPPPLPPHFSLSPSPPSSRSLPTSPPSPTPRHQLRCPPRLVFRPPENPSPPLLERHHHRSFPLLLPFSSLHPTKLYSFLPPSLFLLVTTPFQDQLIHTHEYKAFQFKVNAFEPKSLNIVNIGPSFRSQYESFSPNVQFPLMDFELRGSNAMVEDEAGRVWRIERSN
ncbi:UNVERIFIED_CONTAM: hypothetical protein Scaly_1768000 [Sesamum calycinum]|uniref:Uncharacterized protein n=1 Tax=Sesamum calycinum TaxID=2727403 RepID=A0AAW2NUH4_9LAMI